MIKTQNRKTIRRFVVSTVVIVLLMAVLTACGGNAATKTLTQSRSFKDIIDKDGGNTLSQAELESITNNVVIASYSNDYDSLQKLIIAYRGYPADVKDADVNESEEDRAARNNGEKCNLDYVKAVLKEANGKAAEAKKGISDAELTSLLDKLTAGDVKCLIQTFQMEVNLENDGGFLDTILCGIGWFLNWMTTYLGFGNYIVGICEFAILIEILMIPFAIKQQKNSIKQAKLRPKEMAIRNKYKGRNDQKTQQQVQQEIQELYQRENFSPFSGCLPLLIQLPIILALYQIVINPMHYVMGQSAELTTVLSNYVAASKAAGGMGEALSARGGSIQLLSKLNGEMAEGLKSFMLFSNSSGAVDAINNVVGKAPNFNIGSINFGYTPSDNQSWVLWLIPVINFATYFATAKLNRKFMYQPTQSGETDRQTACSNNMMDISMPLLSTFFTFALPAVVGVYWAFRSWIGFAKTVIMAKIMPLPTFTEEDYKAAAKEMAGKKIVKKSENAGAVRSLHHIDDEDFDDTRERALKRKAAIEAREAKEAGKKTEGPVETAPVKEEKRHEEKKSKKKDEAPVQEESADASATEEKPEAVTEEKNEDPEKKDQE